jgi:hypothetical protein
MLACQKLPRTILSFTSIIMLAAVILLSGCGPRIDGSSEKKFKASYQKIKSELGKSDTAKFDAAIKVIGFSSVGDLMRNDERYHNMSVDAIVMKKLDGKTYREVIHMAEDSLKGEKKHEITVLQKEIDELKADMEKRKSAYDALKSKLSVLQGRLIKIDLKDGVPTAYCEFKNISRQDFDHFSLSVVARSNSKKTLIFASSQMYGGVKTLSHNDTLMQYIAIDKYDMSHAPEVPWSSIKYPVTNTDPYNFKIEVYADELKTDDHDYDLSTVKWTENDQDDYAKKYKELMAGLKTAQNRRDNLDDI